MLLRKAVLQRPHRMMQTRGFAKARQPWLPAHVLSFSLLMVPALVFLGYYERSHDEEHLQETLRERYRADIQQNTQRNEAMKEFFQHAIRKHDDKNVDSELDGLLRQGKGGKKRFYAVDQQVYGTSEGAENREKAWSEAKDKLKRKKKKEDKAAPADETTKAATKQKTKKKEKPEEETPSQLKESYYQSTIALLGVAAIAASAGFIFGKR